MTEVVAPVATTTVTTTTIETEPVPVSSVQVEEQVNGLNGTAEKTNGSTPNGSAAAAAKKKKSKAEPEPPKDPKDPKETVGWLHQQKKNAVHKINYELLGWARNQVDEAKRPSLPGSQNKVTKGEFVGCLKDGTLLANLANKLSPGSVVPVHEGEAAADKTNQAANLQGFIDFAKAKVGLTEEQVFTVEDLQEKGKQAYDSVFNTLLHVGLKANEKFNEAAVDFDRILEDAKNIPFYANISALFNKLMSNFKSNKQVTQAEEKIEPAVEATTNGTPTINGSTKVVEVEEQVNKTEVVPAPPSAVVVASEPTTTPVVAN